MAIILAVPVTIFALVLAATPFSQVARGVMFSLVFWDHGDIAHLRVFPAGDVGTHLMATDYSPTDCTLT